jgi:arylsulfatase A-like enzyme
MRELSEGSGVQKKAWTSGGLHSWANPDGTQKIKDTGPLTKKRIETVDEEILDLSLGFIDKSAKDNKPFFCWFNSTRMHVFTHLKKEPQHGGHVGQLLNKLLQHQEEVDTFQRAFIACMDACNYSVK